MFIFPHQVAVSGLVVDHIGVHELFVDFFVMLFNQLHLFKHKNNPFLTVTCLCPLPGALILSALLDAFDAFFRFGPGEHHFPAAAKAAQLKVHPHPQDLKTVPAAGMVFFQYKHISHCNLHGIFPLSAASGEPPPVIRRGQRGDPAANSTRPWYSYPTAGTARQAAPLWIGFCSYHFGKTE